MARRAAAPKTNKASKKPALKAAQTETTGGGTAFKFLIYLAILGGIGYAATRVPIGGRTAVEHGRELVSWEAVRAKGAELEESAKDVVRRATSPGKASTSPQKAPAKAPPPTPPEKKPKGTKVASAEPRPATEVTADERAALDKLLR